MQYCKWNQTRYWNTSEELCFLSNWTPFFDVWLQISLQISVCVGEITKFPLCAKAVVYDNVLHFDYYKSKTEHNSLSDSIMQQLHIKYHATKSRWNASNQNTHHRKWNAKMFCDIHVWYETHHPEHLYGQREVIQGTWIVSYFLSCQNGLPYRMDVDYWSDVLTIRSKNYLLCKSNIGVILSGICQR